jgi:hypothetical protein
MRVFAKDLALGLVVAFATRIAERAAEAVCDLLAGTDEEIE